jgi:hypothetical protein
LLKISRKIIIHNILQPLDVNASSRNISRNQGRNLTLKSQEELGGLKRGY